MKLLFIRTILPLLLLAIVILAASTGNKGPSHGKNLVIVAEEEEEEEEGEQTGAGKQLSMWFQARAYPDPNNLNQKYQAAWQTFLDSRGNDVLSRNNRASVANWSYIGPFNTIGGRVICIAIDPNNNNNVWAGSASGGMWKSTNAGSSWQYVEIPNLPVLGVSSIIINPSNSDIMYAGTGEVYRTNNSNIGFNVWKARGTYGVGILKSIDKGITWTQVLTRNSSDMFAIQMLEFDPNNNNRIFAAATDGLWQSIDAGVNWTRILTKNYVSDVAIDPSNSNRIAVGVGNLVDADKGVYYTINGGTNWFAATGIPAFNGFIRLDQAAGSNLYASVGHGSGNELFESTNFGQTWTVQPSSSHCAGQYWFSHDVAVNPFDVDSLAMVGTSGFQYEVSTDNRTGISGVHSDMHDVEFDPVRRGRIYIACDGGVFRSTNGGVSWSNMNTGLAATQFYASLAVSPTTANIFVGGLQDNNVVRYNGSGWIQLTGGDGGPSAFHPNGTTVIASHDARNLYQSTDAGLNYIERLDNLGIDHSEDRRTGFMAPVAISKSNPSVMYAATDNLHISTNGGTSFSRNLPSSMTRYIDGLYKTAIALAVSSTNEDKVYVSTSPFSQNNDNSLNINPPPNVLKSLNASNNLAYTFSSIKSTLPDRFVMDFAISPTNDDSVFVVLGGFEDAGGSHIFVTGNGGSSWTDIGTSSTLPDVPFNAILIDPVRPQVLYAGCDFGVYVSPDRGTTWQDYNTGFTGTNLIMDLQVSFDNLLVAATHGRGAATSQLFSGTLPVFFSSFKGVHRSGTNSLEWKTQNESELLRFELERSTNGRTFSTIASYVPGNDYGSFTYNHSDPVNSSIVYYYRVKAIELDGTYKYSPVIALRGNGQKEFQVMNNPFTDYVSVLVRLDKKELINFRIYDASGRVVKGKQFNGEEGSNTFIIDQLSGLSNGMYILEAIIQQRRYTEKLLKN